MIFLIMTPFAANADLKCKTKGQGFFARPKVDWQLVELFTRSLRQM